MPQSVGYGEAEILRVGIRPVEACPPSDWPSLPNCGRAGIHGSCSTSCKPISTQCCGRFILSMIAGTKPNAIGQYFQFAPLPPCPRGPMEIDPQTRDVVHSQYIRRVERVDGQLSNVEFETYPMVKDPAKEGK
jgi:hypothetical protein